MLAITCTTHYEPALRAVFASDPAVAARWHQCAPCTLDEAVAHSVLTLKTAGDDFCFYELWENNELVGYFGVEEDYNYIPTFGLVRAARTPENKAALFAFFRKFTDGYRRYGVGANKCNERVARFLGHRLECHSFTADHFIFLSPPSCLPSS